MSKILRTLGLASATALLIAPHAAWADYPERPITMIVPFSAGGNSDVIARIIADHMSTELGQPVVVENRGGGGGSTGAQMASGARADGYTILFATAGTHSVNPSLRDVGYDPVEDFEPISVVVNSSVLIVANPDVPADTLEELIALTSAADAAPLTFASGGVGTVAHVAGELYNQQTGSQLIHVPYQGAGDVLNDLIAGRVDLNMNNLPAYLAHLESGAVKPLALAATERSALIPDVPTTAEAGLPDLVLGSWFGIVAPNDTPAEIVDRLHGAVSSITTTDAVIGRLAAIGAEPEASESPAAFKTYIADQLVWWGDVLSDDAFQGAQ